MKPPSGEATPRSRPPEGRQLHERRAGSVPAGADWFVDEDISVADFNVVSATGIGTRPSLVVNRSPLCAVVGQRHQNSNVALLTDRKLHCFHQDTLPYPALLGLQSGGSIATADVELPANSRASLTTFRKETGGIGIPPGVHHAV